MAIVDAVCWFAPARRLGVRGWVAAAVSALMAVTGAAVAVAPAPVLASSSPPLPTRVDEQALALADERSAVVAAAEQGRRVEVLSERSEYSQTFATPQGTLVVEEHVRPQWVRGAGGEWVAADASLVRGVDGPLAPRAATVPMRFSSGGDGLLASIGAGDAVVGLRWPESLPEPVVEGNVATYPEVTPGVDLRVVADVDGFTHLVVIRSAKAWERLGEIALGTDLSGVSLRVAGTGAVEAVDGSGEVVFAGPSPMMWDSRDVAGGAAETDTAEGDSGRAGTAGDPGSARGEGATEPATAPVSVEVEPGRLVITPDAGMMADPATAYPVYVDPGWSAVTGKRNSWSLLRATYPSSSFFNPPMGSINSSDSTRGIVRAGFVVEDRTYRDRSVFHMSISAVRHRHVHKATFSLTQRWSYYNCGSTVRPVTELRAVGSFSSSTTWNSQPSWGALLATSNKIRKYGHSCGPQRAEFLVTNHVASAANDGRSSVNLGLRARSETTGNWSRFDRDAMLSITYNSAPNGPNRLRVQNKPCVTEPPEPGDLDWEPTYVTVNRPAFSADASDRDSGQQTLNTKFYWWRSAAQRSEHIFARDGSDNPGTALAQFPEEGASLQDRVMYRMRAITSDGHDKTWSTNTCYFQAWLTTPNAPTGVSSTAYPELNPGNPGPGSGGVGVSGSVTISPPSSGLADVVGYAYTLDSGVPAAGAPTVPLGTGGSAVVQVRPTRDGLNVLRVWSKDKAGLFSQPVEYRFQVRPGNGPAARWVFDDPAVVGGDDTGHGNGLSLFHGAAVAAGRAGVGSAVQLDGVDDVAKADAALTQPHPDTGLPVAVRTDSTFTVAAWVRLESVNATSVSTAVSADGVNVSAFMLGFSGPDNRWRFAMPRSDVDNPVVPRVLSTAAPVLGRWTHLAGTYDAATDQIQLYVNGVLQGSASQPAGFHASGTLVVGRRLWNGSFRDHVDGQVDDVRFYSFIPPVAELQTAAKPLRPIISFPDGATATVGGNLRVRFDAAGDTNVTAVGYAIGGGTLNLSATLPSAGGAVTVTVSATTAGELPIAAASVDRLGQRSDPATVTATITGSPQLSGVVRGEAGDVPVAGATVILDQLGLTTTTGADGGFHFAGLPAGTYTLAAHVGGQCGLATATQVEILEPVVIELTLVPARDSFGYSCAEIPGTPFAPLGGTALALTGDDATAQVSMPFAFPFYGQPRTTVWIDTNGTLAFEDPAGSHPESDAAIPGPAGPNALVAAYWADLVVDSQASVRTQVTGTAPQRTFAVEWRNVRLKSDLNARLSVQVTLTEAGWLLVNYTGMDNTLERGQEALVGIESPGGQMGIQYSYKQSVLANDVQIVFLYPLEPGPVTTVELSGSIVDAATGQPAAGVQVTLLPTGQVMTSGTDGGFTFADLEGGSYTVEAQTRSHCGRTAQTYVELESSTDVQLGLTPPMDEFGYTCQAGPRGFLPTSTVVELSGDDLNQQVSLPFSFSLYGQSYQDVWVNTNGILVFAPESYSWHVPVEIPSVQLSPGAAIYGFWSDLVVDATTSSVRTGVVGTAPNRRFVIEWRDAHHVSGPSARVSFQVVLHETSHQVAIAWDGIDASNPVENGAQAVVGIEDADGTIGLPYQEFDQAITAGQGVLFTPGNPGPRQVAGVVTCAGSPAVAADVRIGELTTVTDAQGGFTITGLPPGQQGLVASTSAGACAGAVSLPVSPTPMGEPGELVEVALVPTAEAPGYLVSRGSPTTLAANTVLTMPGDDDEYVQIAAPFPVRFYGQAYSQAWVDSNGYVSFADPGDSFAIPVDVPSSEVWAPRPAVFPFWNDWIVDELASVRTGVHGTAPNRRWVVEWRNVRPYNLWQRVSFQVVFEETAGRITFTYRDIDASFVEHGGAGLTGVQNSAGAVAAEFSHLAPVLRNDRALVLAPVP